MKKLIHGFLGLTLCNMVFATGMVHYRIECTDGRTPGLSSSIELVRASMSPPGGPMSHSLTFGHYVDAAQPEEVELWDLAKWNEGGTQAHFNSKSYAQVLRDEEGGDVGHIFIYAYNNFSLVDVHLPNFSTHGPQLGYTCKWHRR